MSGILGHSQFFGETASLFADEKTVNARSKIIEWLDSTATGTTQEKCEALVKIQETLLGSNIELLDEFLENIIAMAHDPIQEVRKSVVGVIEQICKAKIEYTPRIVRPLAMLLRDSSPQVIKRVIQAMGSIYKNSLKWICTTSDITESIEDAWAILCTMKAQILDMIDHDNDGIRTNSIKFLEGVVILQTYPDQDSMKREQDYSLEDIPLTLKIVRRRKLEDEANDIFDCLLKFHGAVHISSVNLIACTGSLCTIAKLRPSLMKSVVKAIEELHSNLPPTLTDSQVSSVRKNLKMQLLNLLKNRGSFEMQGTIIALLKDLGSSQQEIIKAIPKMDKQEQQRRTKRALESATSSVSKKSKISKPVEKQQSLEIDYEVIAEQRTKAMKVNEKYIVEALKIPENVVNLVIACIKHLPNEAPSQFIKEYKPFDGSSHSEQITYVSRALAEAMSDAKIGPGSSCFSKEIPMKVVNITEDSYNLDDETGIMEVDEEETTNEDSQKKDEATKKLRETMEKQKGEQAMIARMKQRAKALKLQEITKPISRVEKENFLIKAVKRILNSEGHCTIGGVATKRRKILTVMAATFPDKVREIIFNFIMEDIKNRLDLGFSWLFEEYCLFQGFTRHTYVKSEHRPDYAYNQLMMHLIEGIYESCDFKDKVKLLRKLFLEAPLLPEDSVNMLVGMCEEPELGPHCLELMRDLTIRRPPRKLKFVKILLNYCVHENVALRDKAIENVVNLYSVHKVVTDKIQLFAIQFLEFIECEKPPPSMYGKEFGRLEPDTAWHEELTKICLGLYLAIVPYNEDLLKELVNVYIPTSPDLKRTILRSIDTTIKKIGPNSPKLLEMIEECPKGAETLVTKIIYILTERTAPTTELVNKVRELYQNKVNDVRLLIPIISGLTKKEIINALPKFLKLNPVVVKEIFNRLLGIGPEFSQFDMPITPSELLVALHNIENSKCELRLVMKATSICLDEKQIYTQEILASCLQQLVEIYPLPTLLMRTMLQSLTLYPRLSMFIVNLLQRLILKQVWKVKVIWDGFLKCCQRLKPDSFGVLLQLPGTQLISALNECPELRTPMLEYAVKVRDTQSGYVSQQAMDILLGNTLDLFVTDETGGYMQLENIKKENIDVEQYVVPIISTNTLPVPISQIKQEPGNRISQSGGQQPLPPGEE
ncbi:symplekin [Condylostylus longicornis]|uniref:symplekin n=1 Tax=Condylostylus longicornis TaxID=2530218 RepID=UPI00244D9FBB|nr:symplekin [Condylostylus longicornis]